MIWTAYKKDIRSMKFLTCTIAVGGVIQNPILVRAAMTNGSNKSFSSHSVFPCPTHDNTSNLPAPSLIYSSLSHYLFFIHSFRSFYLFNQQDFETELFKSIGSDQNHLIFQKINQSIRYPTCVGLFQLILCQPQTSSYWFLKIPKKLGYIMSPNANSGPAWSLKTMD